MIARAALRARQLLEAIGDVNQRNGASLREGFGSASQSPPSPSAQVHLATGTSPY